MIPPTGCFFGWEGRTNMQFHVSGPAQFWPMGVQAEGILSPSIMHSSYGRGRSPWWTVMGAESSNFHCNFLESSAQHCEKAHPVCSFNTIRLQLSFNHVLVIARLQPSWNKTFFSLNHKTKLTFKLDTEKRRELQRGEKLNLLLNNCPAHKRMFLGCLSNLFSAVFLVTW